MNWQHLTTDGQLDQLIGKSATVPQVIFKHSIRCSISAMVKGRFDRGKQPAGMDFHYLDLINYRSLSDRVSSVFDVAHESPQVLLVRNGACVYHESHNGIRLDELEAQEMG